MESTSGESSSAAFQLTSGGPDSTEASTSQGDSPSGVRFVKHEVSKMDTLAGLAVKYNVTVGDIKRANGLLSDSAMYARSSILIPTEHLPIGEELQRICAQVLSGVARDPVLYAESQSHPASAAVARIATTLNVVNGHSYPEDVPLSESAWLAMCQCGVCGPMDPVGLCQRNIQPVELELTDRSSEGTYLPPASAGPTRQHESVRRRRNQNDDAESCTDSANSFGWGATRPSFTDLTKASFGRSMSRGDISLENGALTAWFSEMGRAIGEGVQTAVAKVKEAANQPVLAISNQASSGGFGAAADMIVASRKKVSSQWLGRAPFEGGDHGASTSAAMAVTAGTPVLRAKQGAKYD